MRRPRTKCGSKSDRRVARLHAKVGNENELCISAECNGSPETTMMSLIRTVEKWVALNLNENNATAVKSGGLRHVCPPPPTPPTPPQRLISFLDGLQFEEGESVGISDEDVLKTFSKEEKAYYFTQNSEKRQDIAKSIRAIRQSSSGAPVIFRVIRSRLPIDVKKRILSKLEKQNESMVSGDSVKYGTWLEITLALPLGEILVPQPSLPMEQTMKKARDHLESVVFGQIAAKAAILERFHMWLCAPLTSQRPLALCGVPGNGKTTLIREGLAAIMTRPFSFISLGGSSDSSTLLGHGYTYEGSGPGQVAEHLAFGKCMNPIFYFDELDKCSGTPKGDELINALIHLTDIAQSDKFRDRYIGAIDLDASKALCVFTFNDPAPISPVLLDRMQIVQTDSFDAGARLEIVIKHIAPAVLRERGSCADCVVFGHGALEELAKRSTSGGVRAMRIALEQCISKVLLWKDVSDDKYLLPLLPGNLERGPDGKLCITGGIARLLDKKASADIHRSMYS